MPDYEKYSREHIDNSVPACIPAVCPKCGGKLQVFGLGPEGRADFSHCRTICWGCGKRQDYIEKDGTHVETEEIRK